jgi:type II secretory pathway pseudopilin PulG
MLRAECPRCGFVLDEARMARWRRFDRMAWGLGVSAMGFVALMVVFLLGALLYRPPLHGPAHGSTGKAKADLKKLHAAIESYSLANGGRYPDTLLELVVPDKNGRTHLGWTRIPKDSWGNEYLYDPPEPGRPDPRVYSYGRDGLPFGEGDDADIDSLSLRDDR